MLDKYKDKQDKNLRDELKDRVKQSIAEQHDKLNHIQSAQRNLQNEMLNRAQIETMIQEKISHLEAKLSLEEVNRKAMTLKVKASRNNFQKDQRNFWEQSEGDAEGGNPLKPSELKQEMDGIKLELVKEIRDMKNGLQSSFTTMTQSMLEMNSTLK